MKEFMSNSLLLIKTKEFKTLSNKKVVLRYNKPNNTLQASLQCSPRGVSF